LQQNKARSASNTKPAVAKASGTPNLANQPNPTKPPEEKATMTTTNYAGRTQEERRAHRKGEKQKSQEQPGGKMAEEGTEPDQTHSSGKLSEEGKRAWQTGTGIDGGGKT
jgi:hypothetical protein